ncbi:TPA: phosphoribosyltransferase [Aeromonas veronii]
MTERFDWLKQKYYTPGLHGLASEYSGEDEKAALELLFERFTHNDYNERDDAIEKLAELIIERDFLPEDTMIIGTAKGTEADGAMAGLYLLKPLLSEINLNWSEKNISPVLKHATEMCLNDNIKNIVVFDDFIGSGKTLVDNIQKLKSDLNSKRNANYNILVAAFAGMEFGIDYITNTLNVEVTCPIRLIKGISDYNTENREEIKRIVLKMEEILGQNWNNLKLKTFSFGYKKSEALYALIRSNCSNNVFPIFWWPKNLDGTHRVTLLKRLR